MKTVTGRTIVFQGDVAFIRVAKLPKGAKKAKDAIVAHSETGHNHVAERAQVYVDPATVDSGMTLYMKALGNDGIDIVHHRSWDTHETLRLLGDEGSVFKIQRQREYTPEGWRRVED